MFQKWQEAKTARIEALMYSVTRDHHDYQPYSLSIQVAVDQYIKSIEVSVFSIYKLFFCFLFYHLRIINCIA